MGIAADETEVAGHVWLVGHEQISIGIDEIGEYVAPGVNAGLVGSRNGDSFPC